MANSKISRGKDPSKCRHNKALKAVQKDVRFEYDLNNKSKVVLYFDILCEYCPACGEYELKRLNPPVTPIPSEEGA